MTDLSNSRIAKYLSRGKDLSAEKRQRISDPPEVPASAVKEELTTATTTTTTATITITITTKIIHNIPLDVLGLCLAFVGKGHFGFIAPIRKASMLNTRMLSMTQLTPAWDAL